MTSKEKAIDLLTKIYRHPQMYAWKKEAFMAMVDTILLMVDDCHFDRKDFRLKHLNLQGSVYIDLLEDVDDIWARDVISHALSIIQAEFIISRDIDLLIRWLEIREENGINDIGSVHLLKINCHKSALLYRMLEGKDPLPIPPPKSYSYPWYELIEKGEATSDDIWEATDDFSKELFSYPALIINQYSWKILEKVNDNEFIITYSYGPLENKKFAEDKWRASHTSIINNKLWQIKKELT